MTAAVSFASSLVGLSFTRRGRYRSDVGGGVLRGLAAASWASRRPHFWSSRDEEKTALPASAALELFPAPSSSGAKRRRRLLVIPNATPPRIDDSDLLVGDVTVLWLFSLFQKTSSVVMSSSFPGWLAPVTVDPDSLASFLSESAWLISTWAVVGTALGGYELNDELGKEEGEMREAVKGTWHLWGCWGVWDAGRRELDSGVEYLSLEERAIEQNQIFTL